MKDPIHIALAFDEVYAPHGGATMASVLANISREDQIQFHLLDNGLSISSRDTLQEFVEGRGGKIHFIPLDLKRFASFPTAHHAAAAYSRLALPEMLPAIDRIIYLDSDLIVLKSLRPLWETNLGDKAVAAVRDAADIFGGYFQDHKQQLGLSGDLAYFNSGVMLMNLAAWRDQALAIKISTWICGNPHLMLHSDQDALNAELKGKVHSLDPGWNVQAPLIRAVRHGVVNLPEWVAAVRNPAVIHYTTSNKPWNFSRVMPRRHDYHRFAKMVTSRRRETFPSISAIGQRICAEAVEFRHWLAALLKGRLRKI